MSRGKLRRLRALFALLAPPVLFGCSDGGTLPGREEPAQPSVRIAANVGGTQVTAVVVEVTAPDIPVALTYNLTVTDGVATGTLTVPAGSGRTITVRAFDAKGVETHRGTATIAVSEGTNPTVSITLTPPLGGVAIQVQVGSRVIVVTPADSAVTAGDTLRFTARVQDAAGNTIPGAVRWTTSNPVLAPIDSAGLVTAAREGAVEVVATHQGVAAYARLAIRPRAAEGFVAKSVVAGASHSCALTPEGAAYCWGANQWGQLGRGTTSPSGTATPVPAAVAGGHSFTALSAAGEQTCGLTAAGAAYCWGYNGQGQLGDGTTEHRSAPVAVSGGHVFTQVSVGWGFACGLDGDGAAHCWGRNSNGELGAATATTCLNGNTVMNCSRTPVRVSGTVRFARMDAGFWSACGLTSAGAAYCWGDNAYGQLGDGTLNRASAPVPVKSDLRFTHISTGSVRTCAIAAQTQAAYCWGYDTGGGLGNNNGPPSSTPVPVSGGLRFASIEVSSENSILAHTCAVTPEGAAYCWGSNESGELGSLPGTATCTFSDVARACAPVPTPVSGGLVFRAVAAGLSHVCAVTTSDVPYCWGANGAGQAGSAAGNASYAPQRVTGG
jgi:alpha-tubulin suppressor-like RCC1 family protein